MDEPVNPRQCWQCCWLIAAVLLPGRFLGAQELVDPTRPTMAATAGGVLQPSGGPVLQWIFISPSRVEAMISGKVVQVGARLGTAQVMKIDESSVLLRTSAGVQTLRLYPLTEKKSGQAQAQSGPGDHSKKQR